MPSTISAKSLPQHSSISIVVPVLNEIDLMPALIEQLSKWRSLGCEVILVDGGSRDGSVQAAESAGLAVLPSLRGRAQQMNLGAKVAKNPAIVFLHADTQLPDKADALITKALTKRPWGRFNVRLQGASHWLPIIAFFMNLRSYLTGIATGDQAIFVAKEAFVKVGGFPVQPIMEDIELSRRLRKLSMPARLFAFVTTSGRRWEENGVLATVLLMWRLRWAYWRGESAEKLAGFYRYTK